MEISEKRKRNGKYKVGLALSGGGAKGIAHIGVIKALEEAGLKPEIISGVSAGAIVGALYADGKTPEEICSFFKDTKFFSYVNLVIPRKGLMSAQRFETMLKKALRSKTFEDLQIPLRINATELVEGKNTYFTTGTLIDKVVASASVPIFLNPKEIDGKIYVDGGIFNNMPCRIIRQDCQFLIGCHVNPIVTEGDMDSARDIAERIYNLSIQASTIPEKKACDLVIEPVEARNFGMFDIQHTDEIFNIGYECAKKALATHNINFDTIANKPLPAGSDVIV